MTDLDLAAEDPISLEPQPVEPIIAAAPPSPQRMDALLSIPVHLEVVLASVKMPVSKLMELQVGTEIDLEHPAGAEVALVVNGSKIGFGHLFLMDQTSRRVGIRISRLVSTNSET